MGSRFRVNMLAYVLALAAAALAGCQTAPQTTSQTGADNALRGGVSPVAPVDQTGTQGRALVVVPVTVVQGATAAGEKAPPIAIDIRVGADAAGDVKTSGRQETTTDDAKSSTSSSAPAQTNTLDPAAIAAAAGEVLKTAVPGSEAATLATAALEAAKAGDGKAAAAKLEAAKAAAAKAPPAAGGGTPQ